MLKRLFGRGNPTRDWPRRQVEWVTADLDAGSLNGVRLGEPLERLQFFGPGEPFDAAMLVFPELGVAVEHAGGRLESFCLILSGEASDFDSGSFRGRIRFRECELPADGAVSEADLTSIAGAEVDRNTAHGLTLSYDGVDMTHEFDFYDGEHVVEIWAYGNDA